ncbi:MAG TPA: transcription antitermination factor NusB [Flavobacteriales bacterium]|jgi:transcription antitermination protein NusB|nr:transcription antitermination factor NusB [Flavobacteriales bacterium]
MNKARPALINRRYLRIKIFQGLYAYHRTENADQLKFEREMFESINRLYNLYLFLIKLIMQVGLAADEITATNRKKRLPSSEDLDPNMRFVENRVFKILKQNEQLKKLLEKGKIDWKEEHDDVRRIYKAFKEDEAYQLFMIREDNDLQTDIELIITLFRDHLVMNDIIHSALEEKDIYWQDDLPMAAITVIKTLQVLPDFDASNSTILADLYKNKEEDQLFAKDLFRKSIQFADEYGKIIASKADNWETERIAYLDLQLMTMALAELEHFSTIPVKVTLNEYIELAKVYSTPKSKVFINGVLDKLVHDFKSEGRINKVGRGLNE